MTKNKSKLRASPIVLAIMVGQIGPVRYYVKFAEPVGYFASMVLCILVGYDLKIVCY